MRKDLLIIAWGLAAFGIAVLLVSFVMDWLLPGWYLPRGRGMDVYMPAQRFVLIKLGPCVLILLGLAMYCILQRTQRRSEARRAQKQNKQ